MKLFKGKRFLAAFLVVILCFSVMPAMNVEAASKKYVKSLGLSKSSVTMTAGQSTTVKATVKGNVKLTKAKLAVKVKSSKSSVVSAKISAKPKKKAKKGVSTIKLTAKNAGSATITVTTKAGNKKGKKISKKIKVTVKNATVAVSSVALTVANRNLKVGETTQATATVSPTNATNKTVTYSSSNTGVASVSASGLVTAKAVGTTQITAQAGGKTSAAVTIAVTAQSTSDTSNTTVPVSGVSLSLSPSTLLVGGTAQATATVFPTNATNKTVTYVSSNTSVASISASGLVTAKAVGTTQITAQAGGKTSAAVTVTVTEPVVESVKLTLPEDTGTLNVGETITVTVDVQPANATNKEVTLSSSDETVAMVDSEASTITAVAAGEATITATAGGISDSVDITVTEPVVESVKLTLPEDTGILNVGETITVTVDVQPANATNKEVTLSSSDETVATVDSEASTVTAVAAGEATITATAGGISDSVDITVSKVPVTGVALNVSENTLVVNKTFTLKETIEPSDATDLSVKWTSSNTSVATVDSNGMVTAVSEGEAVITVTTTDGGYSAQCTVTVEEDAGVENGFTLNVTTAMSDYSDKESLDFVQLTGQTAYVQVRCYANGEPSGNQSVVATLTPLYGNASGMYKFDSTNLTKTGTTDSDGYINFNVLLTDDYTGAVSATTGEYESYKLKVSLADDSSVSQTGVLSFGTIYLESAAVVDSMTNLERGENAADANMRAIYSTMSKNGAFSQEYVTSQQTSTDDVDHSVTLAAYPVLMLPAKEEDIKTGDYLDEEVAKKSGTYSIYNDETNESTTAVIDTVPAGLEWASIYFNSIELSKYTKLSIKFYKKYENGSRGTLLQEYVYTKETLTDATTVQIPVQEDCDVQIVVALISEGQVDDDENEGYDLAYIKGEWATNNTSQTRTMAVDGALTWSRDDDFSLGLTEDTSLSYEEAKKYLPEDSIYLDADTYTYSYAVPAFPSVGNAVIYVKDKSSNVVAYFNYYSDNDLKNGAYQNANEIADSSTWQKAALVSEDEAKNSVGTITPNGNYVTVDSKSTGYTALKAVLDLSKLGVSVSNSNIYSYIQWAPYYTPDEKIVAEDFYAVAGQEVEIVAQLCDANGSNVSSEGKALAFSLETEADVQLEDYVTGTLSTSTDSKGQCTFTVKQTDTYDYLERLTATSDGYYVKFVIGGKTVDVATIHWITPGLYFKDAADGTLTGDSNDYVTYNGGVEVTDNLSRAVGSTWLLGLKLVAKSSAIDLADNIVVTDISGITIGFTKTGAGTGAADDDTNGLYSITSEATGTSVIAGKINYESVSDDVTFTLARTDGAGNIVEELGTFSNVGTGNATKVNASITLDVVWTESGLNLGVVSPLGNVLDITTATKVYVKLTDDYGNALSSKELTYSVTGLGSVEAVESQSATTDENGIVEISLAAPETMGSVRVTVTYGAVTTSDDVEYTDCGLSNPLSITNAKLTTSDGVSTVTVSFSAAIKESTINLKEFTLKNGDTSYNIESAAISQDDSNVVVLTLTNTAIADTNVDSTVLAICPYTVDSGSTAGMEYQLMDNDGRILLEGSTTTTLTN